MRLWQTKGAGGQAMSGCAAEAYKGLLNPKYKCHKCTLSYLTLESILKKLKAFMKYIR